MGDNANRVTLVDLQQMVHGRTYMILLFQRFGDLHKCKEILHANEEVLEGLKIISTYKGYVWQSISPQYHQPHELAIMFYTSHFL